VLAPGAGPSSPIGPVLALGLGVLVAGRQVRQQLVEDDRGDPRQLAEGIRGSSQALGVAHPDNLPGRVAIVQRLYWELEK
jgi:hypothetical protein